MTVARQGTCFLLALLCLAAGQAAAQGQTDSILADGAPLAFWIGHTESDNLARTATGGRGSYDSAAVLLNLRKDTPRGRFGLGGDVEHRAYARHVFPNEQVGNLQAFADINVVPDRFVWNVRETYGQARTDPFETLGPGNRETFTVLTTGPTVTVPLGVRTALQFNGVYSDRRYKVSSFYDNQSVLYGLGLYRQVRRATRLGLTAQTTDVTYAGSLSSYVIDTVQLSYSRDLVNGNVLAEAGKDTLTVQGKKFFGSTARLAWSRALTARSRVVLEGGKEFLDTGQLFGLASYQLAADPGNLVLTASPLEQDRFGVLYDLSYPRMDILARVVGFSQKFELDPTVDNDSTTTTFGVSRALTPLLSFGVNYERLVRKYVTDGRKDHETVGRLRLDRELGARFILQLYLERYSRRDIEVIEDNVRGVRFVYRPPLRRQ